MPAHGLWVPLAMKENKALYPISIRLLDVAAIVLEPYLALNLIQQTRGLRGSLWWYGNLTHFKILLGRIKIYL